MTRASVCDKTDWLIDWSAKLTGAKAQKLRNELDIVGLTCRTSHKADGHYSVVV